MMIVERGKEELGCFDGRKDGDDAEQCGRGWSDRLDKDDSTSTIAQIAVLPSEDLTAQSMSKV